MAASEATLLLAVCGLCLGATFRPQAYTFNDVSSVNGSDSNAGCPSVCRMTGASNERYCDCTGMLSDTSGVLIDGIIPNFDVIRTGTWASQLYTANIAESSHTIGFQFSSLFMLQEVELHLLFCPNWNIPSISRLTINVYRGLTFPAFVAPTLIGTTTVTSDNSNCNSLTKVSISIQTLTRSIYFIEFMTPTIVGGIYLGEVIFRDELLIATSTSYPLTTSMQTSTVSVSTSSSITTEENSNETLPTASTHVQTSSSNHMPTSSVQSPMVQTLNTSTDEATTFSMNNGSTLVTRDNLFNTMNTIATSTSNSITVIVAVLVGVILCMAIIMIVGGTVCLVIIVKKKTQVLVQNNIEPEHNIDDGYEYITDFNSTARQEVNAVVAQAENTEEIELVKNMAYDIVKKR